MSESLPRRRHSLTLNIGADTLDDLVLALDHISRELDPNGNNTVTGGPSWGGHWVHVVDPEMTHARYFEAVKRFNADGAE